MVLNLDEKCERFTAPKTKNIHMSAENFRALVKDALVEYEITGRNLKRLEALDRYLIDHFHITFGNRIMKQIRQYIPVYVSCGGNELDALDDILSKKIIRKLETHVLYDYLDNSKMFNGTVDKEFRSVMNVPFVTGSKELDAEVVAYTKAAGFDNLKGHKSVGGLRASIYNAMPKDGVVALVDCLKKFEEEHN